MPSLSARGTIPATGKNILTRRRVALVRVYACLLTHDTEIDGKLGMGVRWDEATGTYLGYMPALKLYAQGKTEKETETFMEKAAVLYCETALQRGQLFEVLMARGFKRIPVGMPLGSEYLRVKRLPEEPEQIAPTDSNDNDMELQLVGAA